MKGKDDEVLSVEGDWEEEKGFGDGEGRTWEGEARGAWGESED